MKDNPKEKIRETDRQVDTVAKALMILNCFTAEEPELSLKQLSEKTGLYKSRILRLCGTLIANGFLIRMPWAGYTLGPRLMVLGKIYEKTNSLVSVSRPILRELASQTGESTSLFVIDGTKRRCVAREEGLSSIRFAISEGEALELYAGAGGKVLLAYSSEEFRNQVLGEKTLTRLTETTIVDRYRLEEEFERIREKGYAVSIGERVPEAAAIAAPVFNHRNEIAATITIAGPVQRFSGDLRQDLLQKLLTAARKLSLLLGNRISES